MKKYLTNLIIAGIWLISANAFSSEFRIFHDSAGREIEARIKSYSPRTDLVKIELKNRKVRSVKASIFSATDQEYIRDWNTMHTFTAEGSLQCTMKEDLLKKETIKGIFDPKETDVWQPGKLIVQDITYQLELRNQSELSFKNVQAEYCIYYESKVRKTESHRGNGGWYGNPDTPLQTATNTFHGSWLIQECGTSRKYQHQTDSLRLKDGKESNLEPAGTIRYGRETKDKLIGMCLRLSTTLKSGKAISREFATDPELLGRTRWPEATEQ